MMKKCVILTTFLSVGLSQFGSEFANEETQYGPVVSFPVETQPEAFQKKHLIDGIDIVALPSNIVYHYYNKIYYTTGIKVEQSNLNSLATARFDASKETIFIIHGLWNQLTSPVNDIRWSILRKHDVNVFVVDWGSIAENFNYIAVARSVRDIGSYIADFIVSMMLKFDMKFDKIGFIGHSLGAHIAGRAGCILKGQVDFIVGLDPAGPGFPFNNTGNRLDPTDAKFVQVIHTNTNGLYGINFACGHSDFYPNGGGPSQPGCGLDLFGDCAHSRAYVYYNESIWSPVKKFVGTLCATHIMFKDGQCAVNVQSVMGGYPIERINGTFYLHTASDPPFANEET